MNEYVLYLKDRLGKPQTVNSYQFKVYPIIKFGIHRGYIKDNITFTHLVEQEHIKEIYTKEELEIMLELFRLFLTNCKLKNLADVTIQGYTTAYKYFVAWLGRPVVVFCDFP